MPAPPQLVIDLPQFGPLSGRVAGASAAKIAVTAAMERSAVKRAPVTRSRSSKVVLGRRAIRRAHSIIVRKIEEATDQVDEMHDGLAALIDRIEQRLGT